MYVLTISSLMPSKVKSIYFSTPLIMVSLFDVFDWIVETQICAILIVPLHEERHKMSSSFVARCTAFVDFVLLNLEMHHRMRNFPISTPMSDDR